MYPSRRLCSAAFFTLEQWLTVPAALEMRCRKKLKERREKDHLWTLQRPQAAPAGVLASPVFHRHVEDLR